MKKILVLLGLLIFAGCATKEEKAKQIDLDKLENIGFTKEKAKAFYDFGNSSKIIFKEMDNINNNFEQSSEAVPDKEYKKVANAVEASKKAYKKLNPKNADEYFKFFSDDPTSSPLLILKKMEKTGQKYTDVQAALVLNEMIPFAEKAINANNISNSKKVEALKWYNNNNDYVGAFKRVSD
ncbi:TPA: hypothetical protein ACN1NJ_001543 [Enterococcus faecalis]|uniref:hypothetical protein n=1 Tax=Enterococcus faecalis TaxID=1351 RepID=UPI0029355D82|nr:hypothetical protein [Enterococcus faecalis]MDV2524110.1 hypothetical protein [Enterococcus faecalis]